MPMNEDDEETDNFNGGDISALPEPMVTITKKGHASLPAKGKGGAKGRRTSLLDLMGMPKVVDVEPMTPGSPTANKQLEKKVSKDQVGKTIERTMSNLGSNLGNLAHTLTESMDRRRSSIMQRIGISTGSHASMSVEEMLKEAEKHRPVSAPVNKQMPLRQLTAEEQAWQERWTMDDLPYYYNTKTESISWEKPDPLKTKEELENESGDWTWIPHPQIVWQGARIVVKKAGGDAVCKTLQGGKTVTIPASGKLKSDLTLGKEMDVPLWPLSKSSLYLLEDDLVALDDPNQGLILHNLRARYVEGKIYTWVGASRSVLVSMNPYKQLKHLYNREMVVEQAEKSPNKPPPPHVYGIAADSLENLLYDGKDQAILISGESGAGKTEATKYCLRFLATIAGSKTQIEQRIVEANPILEAFGNAKTLRNNNSSRFGKWTEVNFDSKSRAINGGSITTYLLERSRILYQSKGERNFHIFYQLLTNAAFKTQYSLAPADSFRFLNQSGCITIEGVNDETELATVIKAMNEMGFAPDEQEWVFRTACTVLHLGNIDFEPLEPANGVSPPPSQSPTPVKAANGKANSPQSSPPASNNDVGAAKPNGEAAGKNMVASKVSDKSRTGGKRATNHVEKGGKELLSGRKHLSEAARLLCLAEKDLEYVLTHRTVTVNKETSVIPLNPTEAQNATESFAMALYSRLFDWIVGRINFSLGGGGKGHFVGVLDIFGFEIFEKNSFEQLAINFANEKLQGQFNQSMFQEEEGLYLFEEIEYEKISFQDNSGILNLIEGKPDGLLLQLDDEVKAPGGSDERYLSKMCKAHEKNPKFMVDLKKKIVDNLSFQIVHYAGIVKYDAHGFMQANVDTLFEDIALLGSKSTDSLTASLFPVDEEGKSLRYMAPIVTQVTDAAIGGAQGRKTQINKNTLQQAKKSRAGTLGNGQGGAQLERALRSANTRQGKTTVSQQFRDQLAELMQLLETAESRYIRCVKPNGSQSPDFFDSWLVLEQLTYSGVFEAVAIRRKGFPFRWTHKQFVYQYKCIHQFRREPVKYRSRDDDYLGLAEEILAEQPGKAFKNVKIGKTKVLYRAKEHKLLLLLRNLTLEKLIPWLQARLRGYVARKCRRVMKGCDEVLQEAIDGENDIDALEEAFRECDEDRIGPYIPRLFPGVKPSKMEQARKLMSDLKEFVELENKMDELENDRRPNKEIYFDLKDILVRSEKLVERGIVPTRRQERQIDQVKDRLESMKHEMKQQLFELLEERAKDALKTLNRDRLKHIMLEFSNEEDLKDIESETFAEITRVLGDMDRLDEEIKQGVKTIHRERLEKALEDAGKYPGLDSSTVDYKEAKRLLDLSEDVFVKMELDYAVKTGDEARRIHREIRLQELTLDKNSQKFSPINMCSLLQSPENWAKGASFLSKLFSKDKLIASMMSYTGKPIHGPLTVAAEKDSNSKKNAKNVSKFICSYGAGADDESAAQIVVFGINDKSVRDEVYFQLIKHCTNNSSGGVVKNTEDLLGICLSCFPPSPEMESYLLVWLRTHFQNEKKKRFVSSLHVGKYSNIKKAPSIEQVRSEFQARQSSRFSIQPGQSSGPSGGESSNKIALS